MASHGTLAAKYNISWKRGGSVVVRNQPIADNPPPGFLTNREYAWTPAALKAPAGVRCGRIKSQERESQKLKEEGNAFSVRRWRRQPSKRGRLSTKVELRNTSPFEMNISQLLPWLQGWPLYRIHRETGEGDGRGNVETPWLINGLHTTTS